MRILLVEDNSDHGELMRLALTGHDSTWEVEAVESGEEALRLLLGGEVFDLVFLDYSLPGRYGLEVLEEIRRGEAPPPVVMVTGRGDEQVAVKAMKGGAYDYVVKGEGYLQRLPVVARHALETKRLAMERKQAEKALRGSEERLRTIVEASLDAIIAVNAEGRLILFNGAAQELFQYSVEEALNQPADILLREEICKIHQSRLEKFLKRGVGRCGHIGRRMEKLFRRKDGTLFEAEVSMSGGRLDGLRLVVLAIHDVTDRKRAEEALRESEARYRQLVEYAPAAIYEADLTTGRLLSVNEVLCEYSGYTRDELLALHPLDLMTEESKKLILQRLASYAAGEPVPPTVEYKARSKSGREFWISTNAKYFYQAGLPVRATVVAHDITERKRAEEEVRTSREQLRAFAGRLQMVREEEGTRIAREIHDELGGALTSLKIDFSLLKRTAAKVRDTTLRDALYKGMGDMTNLIDATMRTVRRIATELRPGILDDLGLVAALEWQLGDFQKRTGIHCEFLSSSDYIDLDEKDATALFRIFQESLTNVARHSGASTVCVNLHATTGDAFRLVVEDNGKGIREEEIRNPKSLGLLGIRERATLFGGYVTITGRPDRGTTVTVEGPLVGKRKRIRSQEGVDE